MMDLTLDAPFLELAFYVGDAALEPSLRKLVPNLQSGSLPARLSVANAVGLIDKLEQIEAERGAIVLRTEAEAFCGTARANRAAMMKLGRITYKRFIEVVCSIEPAYGAILVEYSLETPAELRQDPRSLAFRDFFLSRDAGGQEALDQILRVAGNDSYLERTRTGVYISMSPEFNPEERGLRSEEAAERSAQIGSVLAKRLR